MSEWAHPVLPLVLGAVVAPLFGVAGRRILGVVAPLVALAFLAVLPLGTEQTLRIFGSEAVVLKLDRLSQVFAYAFSIYGVISGVYAWSDGAKGARIASLFLVAGGVGITLAGDLVVMFLFWEWLTIASLFLIWAGTSKASLRAGFRYVLFHAGGAGFLLAAIVVQGSQTGGDLSIQPAVSGLAVTLFAIGLLVNAAVPPLHAWLPDAYPEASIFGTVFLSAFTTKSAVYVLARILPGLEVLVWLGAAMTLYGVVFAVLENNIRRLLGYHIISQVGYMVTGVGLGTALAINGASAHAFSHIFYKGLLLMSAGAVIHATGRGKLSELGGLAGSMKLMLVFCMIGAFSISGVPLFNGFVSKSIIISAAAYEYRPAIELMLLVASMGTFLSVGLKVPWFVFGDKAKIAKVERPVPMSMYLAMGVAAFICIATGIAPGLLYDILPFASAHYEPYTADHVVQSLQILTGTALGFWILRGSLGGKPMVTFDVDRLYRRSLPALAATTGEWFIELGVRVRKFNRAWIHNGWEALQGLGAGDRRSVLANQSALIVGSLVVLGAALALFNF